MAEEKDEVCECVYDSRDGFQLYECELCHFAEMNARCICRYDENNPNCQECY